MSAHMAGWDAEATMTINQPVGPAERKVVTGLVGVFFEDGSPPPAVAVTGELTIGRAETAQLTLPDGNVSREHAAVRPGSGSVVVQDLGSRNGTHVDGNRIEGAVTAPVNSTIRVGKTLFRVVADAAAYRDYPPRSLAGPLVGGPALNDIRRAIAQLAQGKSPVLVDGETGTGKECAAEAIHLASGRSGRFITLNCAAIPAELVESELFGHVKGAFSGSDKARDGMFRTAAGGTLLLDEIGDLPSYAQAKLLRVLESGEVRPVGEDRTDIVDVRVVAATNRNLAEMVDAGTFRADLFHRIVAHRITMPPVLERIEDVPLLAQYFTAESSALPDAPTAFSADAMERLLNWRWPGNVRELRHVVLAAATTAQAAKADHILPEHLPSGMAQAQSAPPPAADPDVELRTQLTTALRLREGNVSQVSRDLSMRRPALYEALKRFDIDPTTFRKR